MREFWNRRSVVLAVIVLTGMGLSAAPAGALYCNDDPCSANQHLVCTFCTYVAPVGGLWCRITVVYCVDCHSGDILSWDEDVEYCIYGTI
jgi:hypothetical protein